jgi:hypothetical protein
MRKTSLIIPFFISLFFTSCQEVVDINLDTTPPKLVVEAAINWEKGTNGAQQTIKLTTTTGYFENAIPIVSGATIFIKNSTNEQFNFIEIPNTGRYACTNFKPKINEQYTLTVISKGNTYTASETMKSIAPITRIEQNNQGGIVGDQIEIKAFYNDPPDADNFYLFRYLYPNKTISVFNLTKDKFIQGNEAFSLSDNEDLKSGDEIKLTHIGISNQYYNYMNILISVASGGNAMFQSPPVNVKGNIINTADKDNSPLGYFSLSETHTKTYTVQ